MRKIQLKHGEIILVNDKDYEKLNKWAWHLNSKGYVSRTKFILGLKSKNGKRTGRKIFMHREIMEAKKGQIIDHINGNPLDNRRENLRLCKDQSQNIANGKLRRNNTTGYKGVYFHKKSHLYQVYITVMYKHIFIGSFKTAVDASKAYNKAARKHFGEFALLN